MGRWVGGENGVCGSYLSAAQTALGGGTSSASSDQATALKFAQCMRANGVPDYPDPTGNYNNQSIHASSGSDLNPANPTFQAASTLCTNKTGYRANSAMAPLRLDRSISMCQVAWETSSDGGPGANSGG